jgi:hypothetical protein
MEEGAPESDKRKAAGRRRRRRLLLALAFPLPLLGAIAWLLGCATVVVPPAHPADPVTVFILDHGHTSSLVLPCDGGLVRYAYGDWNYYALGNHGLWDGVKALCWPTRGTLGRKEFPGPAREEVVRAGVLVGIEHLYAIRVAGEDARRLRALLEGSYRENIGTELENHSADLRFVHHPDSYTVFHDSNCMVALWLRELGCRTCGPAIVSRWDVREPEE